MVARANLDILLTLNDRATKGMSKSFKRISNDAVKTESGVKRAFGGMASAAARLGLILGAAGIALALKNIVDTAIEFESAFAGVKKTVDATEEQFARLRTGLITMSKTIPVAAKELAGIQEIAGQLGVRGVANLTKFTETIAKIAVTTNLTREAAATNFARIANIMQEPLDNVDRMGAAIVDLGNNFATTEAEITNFATRIAGAGHVAGLTTPDIMAFGAAFSSVGVRAERGGTAVSKALVLMGTAVAEGGETLEKFADIAGMTSEQFIKAYQDNAAKAFALFIEGLGKAGLKGAAILKELELGDQRLVQAFLSVGGATGILTEAIDMANVAFEKNTALNEEAAKRFGTTASQIQLVKNNVAALNIAMGEVFLPALQKILPELTKMISFLEGIAVAYDAVKTGVLNVAIAITELANLRPFKQGELDEEIERLKKMRNASAASFTTHVDNIKKASNATKDLGKITVGAAKAGGEALKDMGDKAVEVTKKVKEKLNDWQKVAKVTFDGFTLGIGNAFARMIVHGESFGKAMKSLFQDMAVFAIAQIAKIIIKLLILKAVKIATMGPLGFLFHDGGVVKKAHSGMLARDEVPIIAQTGEAIISRRGVANMGGEGAVNRLNSGIGSGGGGGGVTVHIENASFNNEDQIQDVFARLSALLAEKSRS